MDVTIVRAGNMGRVLLASDDEDAKRAQLEALGYLHMAVQEGLGTGYGSAGKLLGR